MKIWTCGKCGGEYPRTVPFCPDDQTARPGAVDGDGGGGEIPEELRDLVGEIGRCYAGPDKEKPATVEAVKELINATVDLYPDRFRNGDVFAWCHFAINPDAEIDLDENGP